MNRDEAERISREIVHDVCNGASFDYLASALADALMKHTELPSDEECKSYALQFYKSPESSTGFLAGARWIKEKMEVKK